MEYININETLSFFKYKKYNEEKNQTIEYFICRIIYLDKYELFSYHTKYENLLSTIRVDTRIIDCSRIDYYQHAMVAFPFLSTSFVLSTFPPLLLSLAEKENKFIKMRK